jgi:hypothetical protein
MGQMARPFAVDRVGAVRFVLAEIDAGVGGAIHHQRRSVSREKSAHLFPVGDVALAPAHRGRLVAPRPEGFGHGVGQHARAAGDDDGTKDIHATLSRPDKRREGHRPAYCDS